MINRYVIAIMLLSLSGLCHAGKPELWGFLDRESNGPCSPLQENLGEYKSPMTIEEVIYDTEERMLKSEDHVLNQCSGVRTGKATPSLIENVMVEAYGSNMRLKELATITAPEARMLMVQPFDQSTMKAVEKGIQASGLGLNPASQGRFIRIVLPDLSSERRQEFVKICKRIAEEGRVAVRNERRQAIEALKKTKNDGGVSEDAIKTAEADVQKLTDSFIAKVDQHLAIKEKEIMTV